MRCCQRCPGRGVSTVPSRAAGPRLCSILATCRSAGTSCSRIYSTVSVLRYAMAGGSAPHSLRMLQFGRTAPRHARVQADHAVAYLDEAGSGGEADADGVGGRDVHGLPCRGSLREHLPSAWPVAAGEAARRRLRFRVHCILVDEVLLYTVEHVPAVVEQRRGAAAGGEFLRNVRGTARRCSRRRPRRRPLPAR